MSSAAPSFAWEGRDSTGTLRRGVQIAASKAEALRILGSDPDPITVHSVSQSFHDRWSLATIITAIQHQIQEQGVHAARLGFYRLAARFLKRGTHVRDAVAQYLLECPSPRFKAVLRDVLQRTGKDGMAFPDAIALHPVEFPRQHVEMLRIPFKQKVSPLPTFERLRNMDAAVRRRRARDTVGRLNYYLSYGLSGIGMVYVAYYYLPNMQRWMEMARVHTDVPPAVVFLAGLGRFLTNPWGIAVLLACIIMARTAWRSAMTHRPFRRSIEQAVWAIPFGVGPTFSWAQLLSDRALALHYLASMRFTGLKDDRSLELTSEAVESVQFSDALLRQAERVKKGMAFTESFASEGRWWGGEVVALIGPAKDDFVPVATELAEDFEEEDQAASAKTSAIKNFGHLLGASAAAALVTGTIYLSSLAVMQAFSQQH